MISARGELFDALSYPEMYPDPKLPAGVHPDVLWDMAFPAALVY
jgi:hypothetical protein